MISVDDPGKVIIVGDDGVLVRYRFRCPVCGRIKPDENNYRSVQVYHNETSIIDCYSCGFRETVRWTRS